MTFQSPWWLLALLVIVALVGFYVLLQLRRKAYAARFTNVALLGSLVPKRPGWRRHLAFGVVALGLAALVVSLAVPSTEVRVPRERATVVMAVDVSLSMKATDIEPDRFRAMQKAAKEFVDVLPERINLGLVSFAGTATTAGVPVSTIAFGTDYGSLDIDGETVPVPVDRASLEDLADQTGGSYSEAASAAELEQVYADLGSQIGYTTEPRDVSYWFVRGGVLLALVGAVMSLLWTNRLV